MGGFETYGDDLYLRSAFINVAIERWAWITLVRRSTARLGRIVDVDSEETSARCCLPRRYEWLPARVPCAVCWVDAARVEAIRKIVNTEKLLQNTCTYFSVSLPSCPKTGFTASRGPPTDGPETRLTFLGLNLKNYSATVTRRIQYAHK